MRAEAGVRWAGTILLFLVALCLVLALSAWPAWRTELPLWDLWPYAGPAFDAFDPAVIFRAHNEHVPATTAAVLWADRWLAAGTYVLAEGIGVALALFAAAWAVGAAFRQPPAADRPLLAAVLLATFASVAALQAAAHAFLLQHLILTVLTIAAAVLAWPDARAVAWPRLLLASLLCILAVVTQANGVALPFVLLLLSALRQRRLPALAPAALLLLPAGLLFLWLYLLREGAPALGHMQGPTLVAFADFLLRLAGAAVGLGLGSEAAERLAGAAVLLAAVPPALALLLRPAPLLGDRAGGAASALFLMTAGGLLASAYGRAGFSPSALYVKYGYYSLLFAGLAAYLNARLLPARWRRPWLLAAGSLLLLANATLLWRADYVVERQAQQLRAEAAGYAFLLDTPAFCRMAECDFDHVAVLRHFREESLNVFAWPEARLLGRSLGSGPVAALPACAGGVAAVHRLSGGDGQAVLRIDGWLAGTLGPRQALFAVADGDAGRRVLGFGFASDLAAEGDGGPRQDWRVYLEPGAAPAPFAILPTGLAEPCRIAVPTG